MIISILLCVGFYVIGVLIAFNKLWRNDEPKDWSIRLMITVLGLFSWMTVIALFAGEKLRDNDGSID